MENTKRWYKSKTVLFNALTALVVIATFFGYVPDQDFAQNVSGILIGLAPVINIALRAVTTKGITL